MSDDWSFEESFIEKRKVPVLAYDGSISAHYFLKRLIKYLFRLNKIRIIKQRYKTFVNYKKFFSDEANTHIEKYVGLNCSDPAQVTLSKVLSQVSTDRIFLSIDIEGSEYRLLDTLVEQSDRFTGVTIEFHDCDLHLARIEEFIAAFDLKLVHAHANNYGHIRLNDGLPLVLELTFSKFADAVTEVVLPHSLDMPNHPFRSEIELTISQVK